MSAAPHVSIVIVNHNGRHLLPDCLASLAALDGPAGGVEIIVVDNASTDGSVEWLAAGASGVRVLALDRNVGFAEGCNRGVAAASAEIVAFLNADTRVDRAWLRELVAPLGGDPSRDGPVDARLAVTAAKMLDWSGAALDFPVHASWRGMPYAQRDERVFRRPDDYVAPQYLLAPSGGAMAVRRSVFVDVGGFDADYFMYHEDLDLGWRLWVLGYRVLFVPTAVVYHRSGGSGGDPAQQYFLNERNALYSVVKNAGDAWLARLLPVLLLWLLERIGQYLGIDPEVSIARRAGRPPAAHEIPDGALAGLAAGMDLVRHLPRLVEKRAAVQARRARSDEEIAALFDLPREVFGQMMLRADLDPRPAMGLIDVFRLGLADTTLFGRALRGVRSGAAGQAPVVEALLYLADHSLDEARATFGDTTIAGLAALAGVRDRDLPVLARVLGLLGGRGLAGLLRPDDRPEGRRRCGSPAGADQGALAELARDALWREAVFYKEELARISGRRAQRLRALAVREARWRATAARGRARPQADSPSWMRMVRGAARAGEDGVREWARAVLPPGAKDWIKRVILRRGADPWDLEPARRRDRTWDRGVPVAGRSAAEDRGDVVIFPVTDWHFRFQRPQHLAAQFAADGRRVFYVAVTFDPPPASGGAPYRFTAVRPGIYEIRLAASVGLSVYRDRLAEPVLRQWLEAFDALADRERIVEAVALVELPFWRPLAAGLRGRRGWRVVYDCLDRHSGFSTNDPGMLAEEAALAREADLVVVTSHALLEEQRRHNPRCVRIPNAADFRHFSVAVGPPPERLRRLPRPVIGYHGAIAEWFDTGLVAELARLRPAWSFVLVGSTFTADLRPMRGLANVFLPGEVPFAHLPAFLHAFDVCIIPFKRLPLTDAADPVKFYEYLSAGKPVVAVPLQELAPHAEAGLVAFAGDAQGFAAAIDDALAGDGPEAADRRRAFAAQHTWANRYAQLRDAIGAAHPRASIIIPTHNNLHVTRLCLESVVSRTSWPNYEVVVVDNASTDGTPAYLREMAARHPQVRHLFSETNEGFARAINRGIAASAGDYIVLLNNDTVVTRGWLSAMIRYLERHPDVGMVGPATNLAGNEARVDVTYASLEEMDAFAAGYTARHAHDARDLAVLGFFCVVIPRHVLDRVGVLDERFELGMFEDDDLSLRVRRAGFRLVCTDGAFVHHFHGATMRQLGRERYLQVFTANRARFEAKWDVRWTPHRRRPRA